MTAATVKQSGRSAAFPAVGTAALFGIFGAGAFLVHFLASGAYGYQRDELYFLVCGSRLAWGYVDQPPLIALIAALSTSLVGDSLHAIRLLPAVAVAATTVLTGVLARGFGAGRSGQAIAMLAVLVAPFFLYVGTTMTMNAFEPLFFTVAGLLLVRILDESGNRTALWCGFAVTIALGILNKYTMALYAVATLSALLVLPQRRVLRGVLPAASILAVAAAIAPNLLWQQSHGWPQIELLTRAAADKNPPLGPAGFLLQQILMVNPATFPLWAAGLWFLATGRDGRYRAFALAYLVMFCTVLALHGKVYYLASIYPLLMAAGAVPFENAVRPMRARAGYAALLAGFGIIIAPQVLPILPLPAFVAYQRLLDFRGVPEENHPAGSVPQQFADMLGWDTFVRTIAGVYTALPPDRRRDTAILTRNYGMAGAVDVLGGPYGLPKAISGHNNYFLWGPGRYDGSSVIAAGVPLSLLQQEFRTIKVAAVFRDAWVLPDENDVPIYLCSDPVRPLTEFWPRLKAYV